MTIAALAAWKRLAPLPMDKWLYSRIVCWKAPCFSSIRPHIGELEPGRCRVRLRKRRAVTNHLGTVHAIAMCNAAELAAGDVIAEDTAGEKVFEAAITMRISPRKHS